MLNLVWVVIFEHKFYVEEEETENVDEEETEDVDEEETESED